MAAQSYRDAGVDIEAAATLVERIKPEVARTNRPGVMGGIGGFGGLFDLAACGFADPVLVAATDGVGTKLAVATAAGVVRGVGTDLVAMCVNDLVVQGATPLFFLDYYATGALELEQAQQVIAGIADGCEQADCALIGGETAEMPGLYRPGDFDLAGFAVGAVERDAVIDGRSVSEGDLVLGLPSSGLHSNGFSLVRKIVADGGHAYADPAPFGTQPLGVELLEPTRIYVRAALAAIAVGGVHAMAHITGGGFPENLPRVLPDSLAARIDVSRWPVPDVFRWLASTGSVGSMDMLTTFNCGIGFVLFVDSARATDVEEALVGAGESPIRIGEVRGRVVGEPAVRFDGVAPGWPV